jgi:mono/diheme cytochrome c family protein
MRTIIWSAAATALVSASALANSPADQLRALEADARAESATFAGFSPQRGEAFFRARHGGEWSCASCHTDDPRRPGAHAVTGRKIEPMAPAVNATRLSDPARTAKWFRRNCKDVLGRECSATEKGDVLAYLLSIAR